MEYRINATANGAVQTLTINGRVYEKRWKYAGLGHYKCLDDDFSEQLENDGVANDEFLDRIYESFDESNLAIDLYEISLML